MHHDSHDDEERRLESECPEREQRLPEVPQLCVPQLCVPQLCVPHEPLTHSDAEAAGCDQGQGIREHVRKASAPVSAMRPVNHRNSRFGGIIRLGRGSWTV